MFRLFRYMIVVRGVLQDHLERLAEAVCNGIQSTTADTQSKLNSITYSCQHAIRSVIVVRGVPQDHLERLADAVCNGIQSDTVKNYSSA